uniref:Uncharacterized protein n=1 Tax=Serinus canaria TaxID=9135 RepID=A0A8C9MMD7_SERCA
MTGILTACKVVKALKGRLKFCNVSADHWSFSRTGTRLLSIKVTVTEVSSPAPFCSKLILIFLLKIPVRGIVL